MPRLGRWQVSSRSTTEERTPATDARGAALPWPRSILQRVARTRLTGLLFVLIPIFLVWELIAIRADLVVLPQPSAILTEWIGLVANGTIHQEVAPTLLRIAIGYTLALCIAIPLGVLMGSSKIFYNLFEPIVELLRPIPVSALVPLLLILLGFGNEMILALIAIASFFPIVINTYAGVSSVDPILLSTARTLGLSPRLMVSRVRFRAALPQIFTGMRISLASALILAVLAEMLVGENGIGYFTIQAQQAFRINSIYAGILTMGLMGYTLNRLFLMFEGRVLGWHRGFLGTRA